MRRVAIDDYDVIVLAIIVGHFAPVADDALRARQGRSRSRTVE